MREGLKELAKESTTSKVENYLAGAASAMAEDDTCAICGGVGACTKTCTPCGRKYHNLCAVGKGIEEMNNCGSPTCMLRRTTYPDSRAEREAARQKDSFTAAFEAEVQQAYEGQGEEVAAATVSLPLGRVVSTAGEEDATAGEEVAAAAVSLPSRRVVSREDAAVGKEDATARKEKDVAAGEEAAAAGKEAAAVGEENEDAAGEGSCGGEEAAAAAAVGEENEDAAGKEAAAAGTEAAVAGNVEATVATTMEELGAGDAEDALETPRPRLEVRALVPTGAAVEDWREILSCKVSSGAIAEVSASLPAPPAYTEKSGGGHKFGDLVRHNGIDTAGVVWLAGTIIHCTTGWYVCCMGPLGCLMTPRMHIFRANRLSALESEFLAPIGWNRTVSVAAVSFVEALEAVEEKHKVGGAFTGLVGGLYSMRQIRKADRPPGFTEHDFEIVAGGREGNGQGRRHGRGGDEETVTAGHVPGDGGVTPTPERAVSVLDMMLLFKQQEEAHAARLEQQHTAFQERIDRLLERMEVEKAVVARVCASPLPPVPEGQGFPEQLSGSPLLDTQPQPQQQSPQPRQQQPQPQPQEPLPQQPLPQQLPQQPQEQQFQQSPQQQQFQQQPLPQPQYQQQPQFLRQLQFQQQPQFLQQQFQLPQFPHQQFQQPQFQQPQQQQQVQLQQPFQQQQQMFPQQQPTFLPPFPQVPQPFQQPEFPPFQQQPQAVVTMTWDQAQQLIRRITGSAQASAPSSVTIEEFVSHML
ncbi:hypothetical protein CYMTET_38095 [Cymbomonas tetramitiformis]|uniref:Uncharacterized protein n=1 Tax=Cymbomonas tetramitiformis TaxID=36881 RepID=A0AAE0CDZ7_9CHLO|nr:hypothetical protein CYMTET_38095 [Cymbomonas tetramitiformis]